MSNKSKQKAQRKPQDEVSPSPKDLSEEELEHQEGEALPKREAMSALRPPGWQFEEPVDLLPAEHGTDLVPPTE